ALANRAQRRRHQLSRRREYDRRVERLGRNFAGAAGPSHTEREGKLLGGLIVATREGEDLSALPDRHLRDDVRGSAEAVETQSLAVARLLERAPADQARTEQRGAGDRIASRIQVEGIIGVGERVRGEAAVAGVAGKQRLVAEVFGALPAIGAGAAGVAEPW